MFIKCIKCFKPRSNSPITSTLQTAMSRFPGSGGQFVLGTYKSEGIAQRACDASTKLIKKTKEIGNVESMKEACRSAASKATGFPSANEAVDFKAVAKLKVLPKNKRLQWKDSTNSKYLLSSCLSLGLKL